LLPPFTLLGAAIYPVCYGLLPRMALPRKRLLFAFYAKRREKVTFFQFFTVPLQAIKSKAT